MRKFYKFLFLLFLISLVNGLIFAYIYIKNNISVSLVLHGNSFTSNNDIFSRFEKKTDVFYWYLNKNKIEEQIAKLPYVKEVKISPVSIKQLNKLNIMIKEEKPFYLSQLVNKDIQVISINGKILSNMNDKEVVINNKEFLYTLPIVTGLDVGLDSSQTLNSRLVFIADFMKKLKKEISYSIRGIAFLPSGEAKIQFEALKPIVIFDLSNEGKGVDVQFKRFNVIKDKVGVNIDKLSKIDLAYEKVGVLKF